MAEFKDREHFLPIRKADLIDLLCRDVSAQTANKMSADEIDPFRRFCTILAAYFHYEYHQRLEDLKTRTPCSTGPRHPHLTQVSDELRQNETTCSAASTS